MVVEGDSSKALYNSAWSLLPDYGTPTESTALNGVNTNTHVMLSVAQGITVRGLGIDAAGQQQLAARRQIILQLADLIHKAVPCGKIAQIYVYSSG